jgi:hypothetical protein
MLRHTTLVFRGDDLISQDPRVVTWGIRFYHNDHGIVSRMAPSFEHYTVVTLSTQPDPQGHIGVATYSCCVDHRTNVGWLLPDWVPPLSEAQAKIVREWLFRHDPMAWAHIAPELRSLLGQKDSDGVVDVPRGESLSVAQRQEPWRDRAVER